MPLNIERIDTRQSCAKAAIERLRAKLTPSGDVVSEAGRRKTQEVFGDPLSPAQVVERICADVREQGLEAGLRYTAKLDGKQLSAETVRVPAEDLAAAHKQASPELLETVRRIRENVLRFQKAILHRDVSVDAPSGSKLRQRYVPLERVGICVPGGAAAYPSTVLMTAVPAQAAGVQQIAVVSPPTANGSSTCAAAITTPTGPGRADSHPIPPPVPRNPTSRYGQCRSVAARRSCSRRETRL